MAITPKWLILRADQVLATNKGRFDGENSNYGLVSINDMPYAEFLAAVRAANAAALAAHRKTVASDL